MIETRRLKNVVIFIQTVLSFVLSRKMKEELYEKLVEMSRNDDYATGNLLNYGLFLSFKL